MLQAPQQSWAAGDRVSNFVLPDHEGKMTMFYDRVSGRPVVLLFAGEFQPPILPASLPGFEKFVCPVDFFGYCFPSSGRGVGFGAPASPPDVTYGDATYIWKGIEHDGYMYAGTLDLLNLGQTGGANPAGFDLWRSPNGIDWEAVTFNGLGNGYNYGVREMLSVPGLGLALGTANPFTEGPGGAEIFVGTTVPSEPPTADAGPDHLVFDFEEEDTEAHDGMISVTLDGTDSFDPFGGVIVGWEWFAGDQTADCDGITDDPDQTEPIAFYELATGPTRTIYDFTLRVTDDDGNKRCDSVEVIASHDLPPETTAFTDPPLLPGSVPTVHLVDFDGDGVETFELFGFCSDPESNLASCAWEIDPGLTFDPPGALSATVTAEVETALAGGDVRPDMFLRATDSPFGYLGELQIDAQVEEIEDDPEANDQPECRGSSFTVLAGTTLHINPTESGNRLCLDPDHADAELTYTIRREAGSGLAEGGPELTYTPDDGFSGIDYFTFRAVDPGEADSRTTIVGLNIIGSDEDPPDVAIGFPGHGAVHGDTGFAGGCGTPGVDDVCGTSSDALSGVDHVLVSLRRGDGMYWDGAAFNSASEVQHTADGAGSWSYPFAPPAFDTYTLRAVAVDNGGNESDPASADFTIVDAGVHIGDLDGYALPSRNLTWPAYFVVAVLDQSDSPVLGAEVSYELDGAPGRCITLLGGRCIVRERRIIGDDATLTVTDVSHPSGPYTPGLNDDPDGSSDGTTITIDRPSRGRSSKGRR